MQHELSPHVNQESLPYRQAFQHPRTSLGASGHWLRLAGVLSPLVIGEFIKEPDKRWRAIRLASVATALVSEALWASRVRRQREEDQAERQR